jgi:hypothetical protein
LRPLSVDPGTTLRDEACFVKSDGMSFPLTDDIEISDDDEVLARPTYRVLNEFADWYDGYRNAHIEYEDPDGETVRTQLENSYQPGYAKRYYAKLKGLERSIKRQWGSVTTVMLTFSASHENAKGNLRCPADHMRDVAEGWRYARKELYGEDGVLGGYNWEYARVWEPHGDGYGHLHVAIFVEDPTGGIEASQFAPVMRKHVEKTSSAGWDAHCNDPCSEHAGEGPDNWQSVGGGCDDCHNPVSVNDNVENVGSYISEYLGAFGEDITERPVSEQLFYAVTWATNTRRLDFSNGAQELIKDDEFRRETGLRPEDRGAAESDIQPPQPDTENDEDSDWSVDSICYVHGGSPDYADPTAGGVDTTPIDGSLGADPPKDMGPPG